MSKVKATHFEVGAYLIALGKLYQMGIDVTESNCAVIMAQHGLNYDRATVIVKGLPNPMALLAMPIAPAAAKEKYSELTAHFKDIFGEMPPYFKVRRLSEAEPDEADRFAVFYSDKKIGEISDYEGNVSYRIPSLTIELDNIMSLKMALNMFVSDWSNYMLQ